MTDRVQPSAGTVVDSMEYRGTVRYAAGTSGWIVPAGVDRLAGQSEEISGAPLNGFGESHSTSSFTVTIDTGEAFVEGKWVARDTTTDVTLASNTSGQTVYVGWSKTGSSAIIGTSGDFPSDHHKLPLWDFRTDGSGVVESTNQRDDTYNVEKADDADTISGLSPSQFLRSDQADTISGTLTVQNGDLLIDTDTGTNHLIISRSGGRDQALFGHLEDTEARWTYENDEDSSTLQWRVNANDTENSDGSNANSATLELDTDTGGSTLSLDNDLLYHQGNLNPLETSGGTITGDLTVDGLLTFYRLEASTGSTGRLFYDRGLNGEKFHFQRAIDSSETALTFSGTNVGVNDTSPSSALDVGGRIQQEGNDVVDSSDGRYEIQKNGTDGSGIINFKT